MPEIIGPVVDRESITHYAITATGGVPGAPMPLTVTSVLGGLGRVVIGSNNRPAQVVALGPVIDVETVPGVTGTNDNAIIGPAIDSEIVGGITATGGTP